MGRRGPPPTPAKILRLRGSDIPDYRRKGVEPEPPPSRPDPPDHFTEEHRAVWDRVTHSLELLNLLSIVDFDILDRYCDYTVRWNATREFLDEVGETYATRDEDENEKDFKPRSEFKAYMQLGEASLRIEREYGLGPAGRARLATEGGKPKLNTDIFSHLDIA